MKRDWRSLYASLTVHRSGIVGKGLFATRRIPARAKIGDYEGEAISLREARKRARGARIVVIVELERHAIDARAVPRGFRFINHSCDPNTFMRCTPERAEFYALRDIRAGEELTVDYIDSQHDGRLACRCGSANCRGSI